MKVNGKNQQSVLTDTVLTGQVCAKHRAIAHDAEGKKRWCPRCGKDDNGVQHVKPNGGWA